MDRGAGETASHQCGSGPDPAGYPPVRDREPVPRTRVGTGRHPRPSDIRRYGRCENLACGGDARYGREVSGTARCKRGGGKGRGMSVRNEAQRSTYHWVISIAAVILAMMAIQMSSLGFSPLLPAIRKDLAASYSQMGLFAGLYGLIAILISLPAGILAARFGEKRMLLSGLAVTAVGLVCLGLSHSYSVALTSRAVWLVGYRF